jgi:nucleoside-diphosphate-sugar epimerase
MSNLNTEGKKHMFVTGATGFIGSVVTEYALAEGYVVRGLSRSEEGDAKLLALGATPVRGDLTTLDVLRHESVRADVVLHLAYIFDLTMDYEEILRIDAAAVDAIGEPLRGKNVPFVITSGTGLAAPDPSGGETTEESPLAQGTLPLLKRIRSERHALSLSEKGVRVSAIRLPPYVYGRGGGRGFVAVLIEMASRAREAIYIGDGALRMSAVHVDDAAKLYLLAAQKARPGDLFNGASSTTLSQREMMEVIGEMLDIPARSITVEEAEAKWGKFPVMFFNRENRASNHKAIQQLGWRPEEIDLVTDLKRGGYRRTWVDT